MSKSPLYPPVRKSQQQATSQRQIFAPLTKFNESTGYFEGLLTDETLDYDGEIMDYERSVKHFKDWSGGINKATDGKSFGNVRAMHGKVAAGILTHIEFDDAAKAIKVCGNVVDENERKKMAAGVYTGLSLGGLAVDKWADPVHKGAQRYEVKPTEASIVDLPANSNATFTVVKATGEESVRKFQTCLDDPDSLKAWWAGLEPVEKTALAKIAKAAKIEGSDEVPAPAPAAAPVLEEPAADQPDPAKLAEQLAAQKATKKRGLYEKLAEKIMAKGAKAQKLASQIAGFLTMPKASEEKLEKGLWTVQWLADLLCGLDCLQNDVQWEAAVEMDGSPLPAEIMAVVKQLGEILVRMCAEEVKELLGEGSEGSLLELAAKGSLTKGASGSVTLEKHLAVQTERDGLIAKVAGLTAAAEVTSDLMQKAAVRLSENAETITKLGRMPAPVRAGLFSLGKAAESVTAKGEDDQVEEVKDPDGTINKAATEIRKALKNPVVIR